MSISIKQLFGRKPKSSSIAKQRLKLVITQDRLEQVDDRVMTRLHHELAEVLAKYFEFSANSVKMNLKQEGNSYILVADFPYTKFHDVNVRQ
ncbi:cell division topological specificity factor MinE [Candidatus Poribacteria bacterium]|nr:MAG: cell division topological specificity factor MinE [Candidatus Poribacteria bacterium]